MAFGGPMTHDMIAGEVRVEVAREAEPNARWHTSMAQHRAQEEREIAAATDRATLRRARHGEGAWVQSAHTCQQGLDETDVHLALAPVYDLDAIQVTFSVVHQEPLYDAA